jgi:2',3'-cyclic-nucleotide 2'-phosphodiesterase (5'-nucleotidase family)
LEKLEINSLTISTRCRPEDFAANKCIGGAGRLTTKINELRALDPAHTLVLNAGDFYQGTIW